VEKTTLPALYIDLEQGISKKTLELYGIDPENLLVTTSSEVESIKEVFQEVSIVVIDSVASAENVMEILRASYYFKVPVVMIGQLRYFIQGSYGANERKYIKIPRTTITLSSIESVRKATTTIGRKIRLQVEGPKGSYEFPMLFYFDRGFDLEADLVRYLLEAGTITRRGSALFCDGQSIGKGFRLNQDFKEIVSKV